MWQLSEEASGQIRIFRCHDDFQGAGSKVQLHKAGIMDLDEFAALPRTTRDVLVSVIVPKKCKGRSILKQRNQSTDFPVLTCAVANRNGRYVAVIGASPYMAELCGMRMAYSIV